MKQIKVPCTISRIPRSIKERAHFRGHEFQAWLLFYGPIALRKVLPKKYYYHFLLLSAAIHTLSSDAISPDALNKAGETLRLFGELHQGLYGISEMTYNIHQVTEHLCDSVRRFGPLFEFSTMPFEHQHYLIKKKIQNSQNVASQVSNSIIQNIALRSLQMRADVDLSKVQKLKPKRLLINGCELIGPGNRCKIEAQSSTGTTRKMKYKRMKTPNGTHCHTDDYDYYGKKRSCNLITALTGPFEKTAFKVKEIIAETECLCHETVCIDHTTIQLVCQEVEVSPFCKSPALKLHVANHEKYLSCDHVFKIRSLSNETSTIAPESVVNVLVNLGDSISLMPHNASINLVEF